MANLTASNSNTSATVIAGNSKAQKIFWNERVGRWEGTRDVRKLLLGKEGQRRPFITKTDLTKGMGQRVEFTTLDNLGGAGVRGDNGPAGSEEELVTGNFYVTVDKIEHAFSTSYMARTATMLKLTVPQVERMLLGQWLGERKQRDGFLSLRNSATAKGTVVPNFKGNIENLRSTDILNVSYIQAATETIATNGGKAINMSTDEDNEILQYLYLFPRNLLTTLKNTSAYQDLAKAMATALGNRSVLVKGGYQDLDAQGILEFLPIDSSVRGPIGSPLNPKALLGTDFSAGIPTTGTVYVKGGGSVAAGDKTLPLYYEDFPNYGVTAGTFESYALIVDVANRKWSVIAYDGNDGNKLRLKYWLGSSDATLRQDGVGNMAWNTGAFLTAMMTSTPALGSYVIPINSYGVAYAYGLCLGMEAQYEAHGCLENGDLEMERTTESQNYGNFKGVGIRAIYGQGVVKRSDGEPVNYLLLPVAAAYANMQLPVINS
jgi:N4-gp56 family major capsid protein